MFLFIPDKPPCSEVCFVWNIATAASFWLVLAWYVFTTLTHLCLYLKWVSFGQRSWILFLCSPRQSLLIGVFQPLMFKVIIDTVGVIPTISVTIFFWLPCCFCPFFVFHSFGLLVLIEHFIFWFFHQHICDTSKTFFSGCIRVCDNTFAILTKLSFK